MYILILLFFALLLCVYLSRFFKKTTAFNSMKEKTNLEGLLNLDKNEIRENLSFNPVLKRR